MASDHRLVKIGDERYRVDYAASHVAGPYWRELGEVYKTFGRWAYYIRSDRTFGGPYSSRKAAVAALMSDTGHRQLASNPGRPPKDWMRRCIKGVEEGGSAADPGAVCGSMWYHKLSKGQKQYRLRKERQGNPYSQFANPWKREY